MAAPAARVLSQQDTAEMLSVTFCSRCFQHAKPRAGNQQKKKKKKACGVFISLKSWPSRLCQGALPSRLPSPAGRARARSMATRSWRCRRASVGRTRAQQRLGKRACALPDPGPPGHRSPPLSICGGHVRGATLGILSKRNGGGRTEAERGGPTQRACLSHLSSRLISTPLGRNGSVHGSQGDTLAAVTNKPSLGDLG